MAEDYKIQLGVALDTSDLRTEINKIDGKEKVKLGVDLKVNDIRDRITAYNKNANNAKLKLGVKLDIDDLKRQINSLNLGGTGTGKGVAIPVNTQSLEASLNEVKGIISSIQSAIGNIGDGSEMKPLLSSVNQIADALGKVGSETQNVISVLNALGKKDFSVNLGVNVGGSNNPIARNAAYGNKVRSETLPQLKQQAESLVKYVNDYYKTSYNELEALQKLVHGTKLGTGDFYQSFLFGEDSVASRMSGGSLAGQMQAFKQYIDMFKQAASLKGLNLDSVTSQFSKSADELVKDAQDIQTGAKEAKEGFEQLKGLFGASIDADSLSAQLTPIVEKLEEIKVAINNLSNGESLGGLTASFDKLSSTLETLLTNAKQVQDALGSGGSGTNAGMSGQAKQAQETANAFKEVANEAKKIDNISIDISDGNIDDIKNALRNLKVDDSNIEEATRQLNELGIVAKNVSGVLKDGKVSKFEIKGIQEAENGLERIVAITKSFGKDGLNSTIKYSEAVGKIGDEAQKIRAKLQDIGFDGFAAEVERAHTATDSLQKEYPALIMALGQLDAAFEELQLADEANDMQRLKTANEEYEKVLKQVHSQLKLNQKVEKEAAAAQKLTDKRNLFMENIDTYMSKHSAAVDKFGDKLLELKVKAENCNNVELDHLVSEFKQLDKVIERTGLKTMSLSDQIKTKFKEYMAYFSVAEVFMYVEQSLRAMFNTVLEIDTAMTGLYRVTDLTSAQYDTLFNNMISSAKEYGATLDDIINATTDWVRAGFDADTALGLAEITTMYQHISDLDYDTAAENLITAYNGFKDELNGAFDGDQVAAVEYIADIFNELDKQNCPQGTISVKG